ncbi:MAG TPA: Uma2 family endonuclease [Planctomycetaceae bacterium]
MSTVSATSRFPSFNNGDRMTRAEFHDIYDKMPEDFRAELVGGVVYMASRRSLSHGKSHVYLHGVLAMYEARTPGTEAAGNATVLLGDEGEPQPDLFLRILPEFGGQSQTTPDDYVAGAPEFVLEGATSSRSIDLHAKYDDYRRYGVQEYVVVCVEERQFRWFDMRSDCELKMDADKILRSQTFPGIWIDSHAVWAGNRLRLQATLQLGLATAEHVEFVKELAARSPGNSKS